MIYSIELKIIHSDILNIQLSEKADILVSEWLGPFGVAENLLYRLLATRDRWLRVGGKMLPERVTAWMAPAFDPVLDSDMFFWQSRPFGLNLEPIAQHTANEIRYSQQHLGPENLLDTPKPMWSTDLYAFTTEDAKRPFRSSQSFVCGRESLMNSVVVWFDAEFAGGILLACGPGAARNHWGSTVCPLERPVQTGPGTEIRIDFACEVDDTPGRSFSNWSVWVEGQLMERHNTRDSIY